MFATRILRSLQQEIPHTPFPSQNIPYIYTNPYRAKRLWPPDFAKIDKKHQFRLERKYKRRSKLKWARPRWTKAVKLTQLGAVTFIAVYGILFMDWNNEGNPEHRPFSGVRSWFFGLTGSVVAREQVRKKDSDDASRTSTSAP